MLRAAARRVPDRDRLRARRRRDEPRRAVARLYAVKGRPADHPVIVHLACRRRARRWAARRPARRRARSPAACWPGPAHARRARARPGARRGDRRPRHGRAPRARPAVALALLGAFGGGIAAPSANRFGRVSPTTAAHVRADLGDDVDVVLDGGPCGSASSRRSSTARAIRAGDPAPRRRRRASASRRSLGRAVPRARSRRGRRARARWRRTTRPTPRSRSSTADELAAGVRRASSTRGQRGRRARVGRSRRPSARRASCSARRPTSTSTRAMLYAALREPTPGLDVVLAVAPGRVASARRSSTGSGAPREPAGAGRSQRDAPRPRRSGSSTPGSAASRCCARSSTSLPDESIVYFGDTGRFPYGPKPADEVLKYSLEIGDLLVERGREGARRRVQQRGGGRARRAREPDSHDPRRRRDRAGHARRRWRVTRSGSRRGHRHRRHDRVGRVPARPRSSSAPRSTSRARRARASSSSSRPATSTPTRCTCSPNGCSHRCGQPRSTRWCSVARTTRCSPVRSAT